MDGGGGGGSYKSNKKLKIEYCSRTLSSIIQKKFFFRTTKLASYEK